MLLKLSRFKAEKLHSVALNSPDRDIIRRSALRSHGLCYFADFPNVSSPIEPPSDSHRYIQPCKAGNPFRTQFWSCEACKKRGVPGAFHQRRPLPPHGPFPLFFFLLLNLSLFFLSFLPLLLLLPPLLMSRLISRTQ